MGALLIVGIVLALLPNKRDPTVNYPPYATTSMLRIVVRAGLPIALSYIISLVSTPLFISRYLIGSLPPVFSSHPIG